jgi:predicted aminopeptidase
MEVLSKRQPISEMLDRRDLDPHLRRMLVLSQRARAFAIGELGLRAGRSYTSYTDIGRPFVAWNVVATPAFSVRPRRWCYPIAGCFNYRGYFSKSDAEQTAARLRAEGLDVCIAGATAYSTLGWFDDPLLSSMTRRHESEFLATLFHELAHRTVYIPQAPAFNEAFAETVAVEGVRRWYQTHGPAGAFERFEHRQARRRAFQALLAGTRHALATLYERTIAVSEKRRAKKALFEQLQASYRRWKVRWSGYDGYDAWMAQPLNNAHLALIATYHRLVPAFQHLLADCHGDLPRFYHAVRRLGALPPKQRRHRLERLSGAGALGTGSRPGPLR